MLGCVYLILAALLGREITHNFLPEQRMRKKGITPLWVTFAASFGSGVLMVTPPAYSSMVTSTGSGELIFWSKSDKMSWGYFCSCAVNIEEKVLWEFIARLSARFLPAVLIKIVFLLILLAGITWIMVFVFHVSDGYLYSGFTVFGDYAPHTAMMRSFSLGNNFPTQYPHFGGEDVKYHFMFQFPGQGNRTSWNRQLI